jgi:hypothetical protein
MGIEISIQKKAAQLRIYSCRFLLVLTAKRVWRSNLSTGLGACLLKAYGSSSKAVRIYRTPHSVAGAIHRRTRHRICWRRERIHKRSMRRATKRKRSKPAVGRAADIRKTVPSNGAWKNVRDNAASVTFAVNDLIRAMTSLMGLLVTSGRGVPAFHLPNGLSGWADERVSRC